jgi:hypothetical protein
MLFLSFEEKKIQAYKSNQWCNKQFIINSTQLHLDPSITKYSQTCIKRTPLGQTKSGLSRQVTSYKRLNWYGIFYDSIKKNDL